MAVTLFNELITDMKNIPHTASLQCLFSNITDLQNHIPSDNIALELVRMKTSDTPILK